MASEISFFLLLMRFCVLAFLALCAYFAIWPLILALLDASGGDSWVSGHLMHSVVPSAGVLVAAAVFLRRRVWRTNAWPTRLAAIVALGLWAWVLPPLALEVTHGTLIRVACFGFGVCI